MWRYENYGSADLLVNFSGTTLTNLPVTQSKSGSAFYGGGTEKDNISSPSGIKEIWIKLDLFFSSSFARGERFSFGHYSSALDGYVGVWSGTNNSGNWAYNSFLIDAKPTTAKYSGIKATKGQLHSVLLHMVSSASGGIIELTVNGSTYTYTGNVNNGADFDCIYFYSNSSNVLFSNIIVSDSAVALNDNADINLSINFDSRRLLSNTITLAFDSKRIIDLPFNLSLDSQRIVKKFANIFCDAQRIITDDSWRYENAGSADLLTVSGTTLTNLPVTQSKTGIAFWQKQRTGIFDIPASKELWIKFDLYFGGAKWRVYDNLDGNDTGIGNYNNNNGVTAFINGPLEFVLTPARAIATNSLHTFLLHMVSDSSNGIVELWVDGVKFCSDDFLAEGLIYQGNVENGSNFNNLYLQSDGATTFFSNVIISNKKIGLGENVIGYNLTQSLDFDAQRLVKTNITFNADAQSFIFRPVNFNLDAQRLITNPAYDALVATNTKVLLHFDDDDNPFFDECGNTWEAMGNPVIAADNAKFGKALQADGDYNFILLYPEFELGGQDFTIDCFFYVSSQSGYSTVFFRIFDWIEIYPRRAELHLKPDADWKSGYNFYNYTISTSLTDSLHHLEFVYQYNEQLISIFIDGVKQCQVSGATKYVRQKPYSIWVGNNSGLIGAIDEFRIVDGVAVHTQNFTPPTAPYSLFPKIISFDADAQRIIKQTANFTSDFDAQRLVYKSVSYIFNAQRIIKRSLIFKIGTQRFIAIHVDFYADAKRDILHNFIVTPAAGGILYSDSNDSTDIQSIQLDISPQQITDQFSFTTISNVDILQSVKGQYLDYIFNLRVEKITSKGILNTCLCCADVDELLYKQLAYKVKGTSGGTFVVDQNGKTIMQEKPKASALSHITKIANILGKNLVTAFDNFTSTVDTDPQGVTYNDLIRDIFGWSSRVPTRLINCYIRNDTLYVIQRGHEQNTVDITNLKITRPTIAKELFRTTWGSTPTSYTVTQKQHNIGDWEPVLGNPLPDDYPSSDDDEPSPEPSDTSRVLPRRVQNDDSVIEYEYDDDGNVTKTTTTTEDGKTIVENSYSTINGRKYLAKERTTEYDRVNGELVFIDSSTVYHDYLTQGQQNITAIDAEGKIKGSLTSSAKVDDRPTPFENKRYAKSVDGNIFVSTANPDWATYTYVNGVKTEVIGYIKKNSYEDKELTVNGIALYDSSFPIEDIATLKALTAELQRLNRTTQETVTLDIFDFPHIFDFNDKIFFGGNVYFLDSNSVSKSQRIVNKQSLRLVRWI